LKAVRLYIILFGLLPTATAQKDSLLKWYKTYEQTALDFNADQMGNLYLVTPAGRVKKISEKGDSLAIFNLSKRYGKLTAIDVANPLKILLFYKDFSTIIVTDRVLNITNTIDLRKKNIYQVKTVATSYDGQIWFYDEQEAKIKKINEKGEITFQSVDLRQVLSDLPAPQKMIDIDNLLYLYDPQKGIFIFDDYGAFKTKIAIQGWNSVVVFNQTVYGFRNDSILKLQKGRLFSKMIPFGKKQRPAKMVVAAGKIYFLFEKEIRVYDNQ
jgi:hypothetical protein